MEDGRGSSCADQKPFHRHGQQDNTWKTARLDNGVGIHVPQFIKVGDMVRLDIAALRYVDRAKAAAR